MSNFTQIIELHWGKKHKFAYVLMPRFQYFHDANAARANLRSGNLVWGGRGVGGWHVHLLVVAVYRPSSGVGHVVHPWP